MEGEGLGIAVAEPAGERHGALRALAHRFKLSASESGPGVLDVEVRVRARLGLVYQQPLGPLEPACGNRLLQPTGVVADELQGHGVFGKLGEHFVIALERQGKLLSGERFVGQARQLAQPDGPRIGLELRVYAKNSQQLVNRNRGAAPLDRDIVDRSDAEALSRLFEDAVADAEAGAKFLVYAFEPGADIDAVPAWMTHELCL